MSNEALENICLKCEGQCRMTHKGGCAFRNIDNSRCDDYEELENIIKQNQKYKEVIDKIDNFVRKYMDEWSMNGDVWHQLNEILILIEEVK